MTSSLAQSAKTDGGVAATVVGTFAGAQTAHNCNVLKFGMGNGTIAVSTVVDTAGNTYTPVNGAQQALGPVEAFLYVCLDIKAAVAGNVVTVTFAGTASFQYIVLEEWHSTAGVYALATGLSTGGTAIGNSASASISQAVSDTSGLVLLGVAIFDNGGETVGAGFTLTQDCPSAAALGEYKLATGATTYAITATGASGPWAMVAAVLVEPGGGAPAVAVLTMATVQPQAPALPPAARVFAGFGLPAVATPPIRHDNAYLHDAQGLPPQPVIVVAQTTAVAAKAALFVGIPAPAALLPPVDSIFAGFGQPPGVAQIVVAPSAPAPAAIAPLPAMFAGANPIAANAPSVIEVSVPSAASLPPSPEIIAGAGAYVLPAVVIADAVPPTAMLPPAPELLAGAGLAVLPAYVLVAAPAPAAGLPSQPSLLAGFGSYVLPSALVSAPASYGSALPPAPMLFAGVVPAFVGTPPLIVVAAPAILATLPPVDAIFAGAGQAPGVAGLAYAIHDVVTAPLLPPASRLVAGYGQSAGVLPPPVFAPTLAYASVLPRNRS